MGRVGVDDILDFGARQFPPDGDGEEVHEFVGMVAQEVGAPDPAVGSSTIVLNPEHVSPIRRDAYQLDVSWYFVRNL